MRMTATSMPTNRGVLVSSVPSLAGTVPCLASDPASPSAKISGANLPSSITMPPTVLNQIVFVPRPPNADPLLLAIEVNAYMISVRPCGPGLNTEDSGDVFGDGKFRSARESPDADRMMVGSVRKYNAAYFISLGRIFLPRYSGVRPTISPPTNTVTMARIKMPYMPAPIPPGAISPSAMSNSAMPPPNGVSESWKQLTAPVEVTVVEAANSEQPAVPVLVSTPSIAPCARCGASPAPWASKKLMPPTAASQMITMTASSAKPCRLSLTILPNVRGVANGISSSRKISNQLVNGFGFSNGCAELALQKPPPLLPMSLMTSCEATWPPTIVWCAPDSVVTVWKAEKFSIAPLAIRMMAPRIDRGSSSRMTARVRSTQKLPSLSVLDRTKPRISAIATTRPTAADRKFCTARPDIWTT